MNSENSNNSKFSTYSLLNQLTSILFYLSILLFIIAFKFTDTPLPFGWYQQFVPNVGNRQITDITFLDSLNGYAVATQTSDTSYILKTTNSGDNWQIVYRNFLAMTNVQFLNVNTGFACGGYLYKTTNGGFNWSQVNTPLVTVENMYVINENIMWFVWSETTEGGVFYTSTGGASWQQQVNLFGSNPDRIYMFNARIGFISRTSSTQLYKTTNSGQNWNAVTGIGTGSFNDMYFVDSLTGWKIKTVGGGGWPMGKTSDGGFNWAEQILPFGGNIMGNGASEFMNRNNDTIWVVGESIIVGGSPPTRGILYRTTNAGDIWKFQVPDTSIHINRYFNGKFINRLNGWAYHFSPTGIHTTTGGDTTFYLPVKQISSQVPKEFKLYQNYPNPFNPITKIKYETKSKGKSEKSKIEIIVYDITGKQITELVSEQQSPGTYEVEFRGINYSSGIYFYSLIVDGKLIDTRKMLLVK